MKNTWTEIEREFEIFSLEWGVDEILKPEILAFFKERTQPIKRKK